MASNLVVPAQITTMPPSWHTKMLVETVAAPGCSKTRAGSSQLPAISQRLLSQDAAMAA